VDGPSFRANIVFKHIKLLDSDRLIVCTRSAGTETCGLTHQSMSFASPFDCGCQREGACWISRTSTSIPHILQLWSGIRRSCMVPCHFISSPVGNGNVDRELGKDAGTSVAFWPSSRAAESPRSAISNANLARLLRHRCGRKAINSSGLKVPRRRFDQW
jgi:hypothetical protein